MKKKLKLIVALVSILSINSVIAQNMMHDESKTIFQVAPIAALAKSVYDGTYTYGELKKHGNFGLGTFLDLNGEMLALDGQFYQMMENGHLKVVGDKQVVPFATVSYFNPSISNKSLPPAKTFIDMNNNLLSYFTNKNVPYAIRIDGTFNSLKVRVVRKQTAPFKPLAEAAKDQAIFNLKNVKGTLIGYWFPDYLSGIDVTSFHFHFIDSTRTIGGHVLDLDMANGQLSLEQMSNINIYFPNTPTFANANLSDKTIIESINYAEKNH